MGQGSSRAAPVFSGSLSCPHLTRPGLSHLPWGSATSPQPISFWAAAPSQSCPTVSQSRAFSGSNSWPSYYKSHHISFFSAQQKWCLCGKVGSSWSRELRLWALDQFCHR